MKLIMLAALMALLTACSFEKDPDEIKHYVIEATRPDGSVMAFPQVCHVYKGGSLGGGYVVNRYPQIRVLKHLSEDSEERAYLIPEVCSAEQADKLKDGAKYFITHGRYTKDLSDRYLYVNGTVAEYYKILEVTASNKADHDKLLTDFDLSSNVSDYKYSCEMLKSTNVADEEYYTYLTNVRQADNAINMYTTISKSSVESEMCFVRRSYITPPFQPYRKTVDRVKIIFFGGEKIPNPNNVLPSTVLLSILNANGEQLIRKSRGAHHVD